VALRLAPEEPEAAPWRAERLTAIVPPSTPGPVTTAGLGAASRPSGPSIHSDPSTPTILAIDGRSSSGKTTLAARISDRVAGSVVVHTDDIAWRHSRFGWADLLVNGVLRPARQGGDVRFRPPRWTEHGRAGFISVPVGCPLLVVEGVGAGRREIAGLVDALYWVQSDQDEAHRRDLARVGTPGGPRTVADLDAWMSEEVPFCAADRAWERADRIVCGTPEIVVRATGIAYDPATDVVVGTSRP
jgi:hypothetical protein